MNTISINQIPVNNSFTDDSFVLDDLFFLPKKLPIQQHHIKLLQKWNITEISTEGNITSSGMDKLVKTDNDKDKEPIIPSIDELPTPNDTSSDIEPLPVDEVKSPNAANTDDVVELEIIEKKEADKSKLLDSSVKGFVELYKKWIKQAYNILNGIIKTNTVDKEAVKRFIVEIIDTVNENRNNALMVFGKEFKGVPSIYPQTIETIILSYIIGESLNLSNLALSNLAIAALFHDIGMLMVPDEILNKLTPLTSDELAIIQKHTVMGYKLLRDIKYSAIIASGALQHHERIDGKGYPNKLSAERVTEIAKIISVADAYCAAISNKPYKHLTLHGKEAIQDLLRGGGTAYEHAILKELIKNISFYPIGSLVLLSDNQPARVVGTSGVPMKPIVKVLNQPEGTDIINLSKTTTIYIKGLYAKK